MIPNEVSVCVAWFLSSAVKGKQLLSPVELLFCNFNTLSGCR